MAQGDVLQIDNVIQLDGDGKIRLVDADSDCPACCDSCTAVDPGDECTNCDDVTPTQYQATFSEINTCPCTEIPGESEYLKITLNFNINDTYTISKDGSCAWGPTVIGTVDWSTHDNSDCSDAANDSGTEDAVLVLGNFATFWQLIVTVGSFTPTGLGSITLSLFQDRVTQNTDGGGNKLCATVPLFTNTPTVIGDCLATDPANQKSATYGGTATVVCL